MADTVASRNSIAICSPPCVPVRTWRKSWRCPACNPNRPARCRENCATTPAAWVANCATSWPRCAPRDAYPLRLDQIPRSREREMPLAQRMGEGGPQGRVRDSEDRVREVGRKHAPVGEAWVRCRIPVRLWSAVTRHRFLRPTTCHQPRRARPRQTKAPTNRRTPKLPQLALT